MSWREFWIVAGLAAFACRGGSDQRARANGVSCNTMIVSRVGYRGACAAGTSTAARPGLPMDFAGRVQQAMPLSAERRAGFTAAHALAARRNAGALVDRGFGGSMPTRRQ